MPLLRRPCNPPPVNTIHHFERNDPQVTSSTNHRHYSESGLSDIIESFRRRSVWLRLGSRDLFLEHSRAYLGTLWPLIGAVSWIAVIYLFVGQQLSAQNATYLAYLTIGIVAYNFASGILVNGVNCFQVFKGVILNIPNPLFIYPLRMFVKVTCSVLLQIIFIAGAMIVCNVGPSIYWIWLIPGLILYVITAVFLSLIMGILGVWFGDFRFLLASVMRLLMFATPIFWYPIEEGWRYTTVLFNPLSHYIDFIRDPLLGEPIKPLTIAVVLGTTAFCVLFGLYLFGRCRSNIARKL